LLRESTAAAKESSTRTVTERTIAEGQENVILSREELADIWGQRRALDLPG
jgi:hypothetical protein